MRTGNARAEKAQVAARRAKLVEYRRQKRPYKEIYEELGYGSPESAAKDFTRALQESIAAQHVEVEVYREEQILELEYLAEEAHKILRSEHFQVSQSGKIVEHPDTGQPLPDPGPVLAAMDRLVKILDRVAKLRGLDAPKRWEVVTIDAIDAAIADLNKQVAAARSEAGETPATTGTTD